MRALFTLSSQLQLQFFTSALSLVALSSNLNIFPLIFSSIVIRIHIFGGKDCDHLCLAHSRQEGHFLMAVVAFIVILFVITHKLASIQTMLIAICTMWKVKYRTAQMIISRAINFADLLNFDFAENILQITGIIIAT